MILEIVAGELSVTAATGDSVILLADDTTVTVVHLPTGEIMATNEINPDKTYWRITQED